MKTRIAAVVTIVGLTGLPLSTGSQKSASLDAKPLIRTRVMRRTGTPAVAHTRPGGEADGGGHGD